MTFRANFTKIFMLTNLYLGETENKIHQISFELHLPQNVCLTQTDIFQKQSNYVQDTPKLIKTFRFEVLVVTKCIISSYLY